LRRISAREERKLPLLEIKDLKVRYSGAQILHGIELHVDEKECVAVLGPNGAGKTTLLRAISNLAPTEGEILFGTRDITDVEPYKMAGIGVIHCPENRRLFPEFSVKENLFMGAYLRSDKQAIQQDIELCYRIFPVLKERVRQMAQTMSGGEQQMIAIARAIMGRPRLLMLDEPSLGLAQLIKERIFEGIGEIKNMGVTILIVEQDAVMAMGVADRVYILEGGKLTLTGTTDEIWSNPHVKAAYLGMS
jgi:branched-chain amino acid transport system ATP-binding protein